MLKTVLALLLAAAGIWAQEASSTATLTGFVTDPTGAAIIGAKITAKNTASGFTSDGQTNETGRYFIPFLNPGPYELRVEASGFRAYVRTGIELRAAESPRIDVVMQLGSVNDSVTVSGTAPLLETETAVASAALASQTVERMPIMQSNIANVFMYLPGVADSISSVNPLGQRSTAIGNSMDGVTNKSPVSGSPTGGGSAQATIDSLEEVRVMSTGIAAEYGRTGPGLLVSVMKSGTNILHGSAEDRWMGAAMCHRKYFDTLPSETVYHQMQASLSGPVVIPRIYDGRNKTFFLLGYAQHHERANDGATTNVPSLEMLNGDFSFGGSGYPLYDPSSARLQNGVWVRDPIPGNKIAPSQFDPAVQKFLSYLPWKQPNTPGFMTTTGPQSNLNSTRWKRVYNPWENVKVDHQLNPAHKFFVRWNYFLNTNKDREGNDVSLNWDVITPGYDKWDDVSTAYGFSDTYTISPTMVNEFRVNFNRYTAYVLPPADGQGWAAKLGIPNVPPDHFPTFANLGFGVSPGGYSHLAEQELTISESLLKTVGRHTFKMGGDFSRAHANNLNADLASGSYTFGGTCLPSGGACAPNTGNNFASFLLGAVSSATFTKNLATWQPQYWVGGLFVQDDFRPTRNLTINMGLRWTYQSPYSTKYGQQSTFDPTVVDPVSGLTGAITHPSGLMAQRQWTHFQPRLGVAWSFRPKFVFRGSFGILTQDLAESSSFSGTFPSSTSPTYATNQAFDEYVGTDSYQAPPGDPRNAFFLSQGPPTPISYAIQPNGTSRFVGTNYSARTATWMDTHLHNPYIMSWSGGFEYQPSPTWLLQALYQGTAGVGLLEDWDINTIPLNISTNLTVLNQIYAATQNYKPYPQFGSIYYYSNFGHSTFHSATLRAEKRYGYGLVLNSFYTYSKAMDESDSDGLATGVTYYNRRLEKAQAGYNMPHRFVTTATYDLPVGVGRHFLNKRGFLDKVFGGWRLGWENILESGRPFTVTFSGSPNRYLPEGSMRPNILVPFDQAVVHGWTIGPNRLPQSAQNPYLIASAFAYPAAYTAGTLGRNTFRSPFVYWPQGSLGKQWHVYERVTFDLRWDINNPFKGAQLAAPGSTYNTGALGNFGTFNGVLGSFAGAGSRTHSILVFRVEW